MPVPSPARGAMPPARVVLLLTLLLGIQPVTTDLYLPALPTLQRALDASIGQAQLTLSALILAFGLAQLVAGPMADRLGRRPVLLAGLALYTAASAAGAQAGSIEALVGWRVLQGIGMATAVTGGRSIVRDLYAPQDGARVMARALTGLGVIALASPLSGALLVQGFDWRAALLAVATFGAATLAWVAWRFEETVPQRDPRATDPARLLHNAASVLAHPTFRAWTLLSSLAYGGLFCILAGSSFVFMNVLGLSRLAYGALMMANSIAYIGGTLWCRHLLRRHGLAGAARRAGSCSLLGGGTVALLSLAGVQAWWALLPPMLLFSVGHGVHQPCGQAGAIGPFPDKAGTAAALSGFFMMATAFGVGLVLGRTLGTTVYPLTLGLGVAGVLLFATAFTLVRRHGDAGAALPATAGAA